jgi:hypothetical protein
VLPPLPSGPLSQLPMDQIPATPAKVTYQGGLLTISAQNSTLSEILRDVHKLTGASIELPPGSNGANERVVTHIGPGAPRDVLVGLLNGSSFNYVMLGSSSDPAVVSSVILTPKETLSGQNQSQPQQQAQAQTQTVANVPNFPMARGFNPQAVVPQPGNGVAEPNADGEETKDDEQEAEENTDDQAQPAQVVQPVVAGANGADQQPQDPNQPNAGPKTPEQILEMLRRPGQQSGIVINPPGQQPQPQE